MPTPWPNSDPVRELENCVTLLRLILSGEIVPAEIVNQIERAQAVLKQSPASAAAAILGHIGGSKTSPRKAAASRANAKKGGWPKGRPRKEPK